MEESVMRRTKAVIEREARMREQGFTDLAEYRKWLHAKNRRDRINRLKQENPDLEKTKPVLSAEEKALRARESAERSREKKRMEREAAKRLAESAERTGVKMTFAEVDMFARTLLGRIRRWKVGDAITVQYEGIMLYTVAGTLDIESEACKGRRLVVTINGREARRCNGDWISDYRDIEEFLRYVLPPEKNR